MRKNWPYLLMLAAVLFILFQVSIRSQPAKVNWSENFTYNSEIPFGCYVFRDYSESLFGQVEESEQTAYDRLADSIITGYNYIFINSYFAPSEPDVHQLLDFVHRGNTVFISARSFGLLGDSLNIETGDPLISALGSDTVLVGGFVQDASDSIQANLLNPSLRLPENTVYSKTTYAVVFTEVDSVNTTLLGTDSRDFPNFIRVKAGAGEFYLHTLPDAFANFYAAAPKNAPYLFRVLSYLEIRPTILDAHYKTGRLINDDSRVYLFAEPTLKYGYYVAITAGLLALLFALKRRQRAVPVVMPEMNTTLQFVEQVGVLY
ncbi:MAG TPA: DUF4350 domain-containing protein, partial [Bacteroidia bacterium]|nr:DUF4350 domain-containing protein [Bacteroidia bacterium]